MPNMPNIPGSVKGGYRDQWMKKLAPLVPYILTFGGFVWHARPLPVFFGGVGFVVSYMLLSHAMDDEENFVLAGKSDGFKKMYMMACISGSVVFGIFAWIAVSQY